MHLLFLFEAQLEAELKSLEGHYEEKLEVQGKEAFGLQESIMQIAYDINEMQRRLENAERDESFFCSIRSFPFSKIHLEAEIIVYRYLLDNSQVGGQVVITSPKTNYESGMSGKLVAKSRKKKSIGIST